MNLAHVHLILNHVPVIGVPIALIFLIYGLIKREPAVQRCSLLVLVLVAAVVVPVYFTGEPAEHVVEHLPEVADSFIEAHEDAAMYSLVFSLATGALALLALFFQNETKQRRTIAACVLFVGAIAVVSLAYTANLGGQIRHSEFRASSVSVEAGSVDRAEPEEDHD